MPPTVEPAAILAGSIAALDSDLPLCKKILNCTGGEISVRVCAAMVTGKSPGPLMASRGSYPVDIITRENTRELPRTIPSDNQRARQRKAKRSTRENQS